jgi:hypothetical protein
MKLYQPVVDKINELGPTKAAAFFKKSIPTIHSWRKKPDKIPLDAVQILHDVEPQPAATQLAINNVDALPEQVVLTPVAVGDRAPVKKSYSSSEINDFIGETLIRLDKLENFARIMTDPDRRIAGGSLLRPANPPQATQPAASLVQPSGQAAFGGRTEQVAPENDPSPKMSTILRPSNPVRV